MSEQFIGQIRIMGCNFAPQGFMACNGATLAITQYTALYSLLGNYFGGDGKMTFALPDMRGRTFLGYGHNSSTGGSYPVGQNANCGETTVTLTAAQAPAHTHSLIGSTLHGTVGAAGALIAGSEAPKAGPQEQLYGSAASNIVALNNNVGAAGQSGAHNNMQPYQALNFIIASTGYYPPRP